MRPTMLALLALALAACGSPSKGGSGGTDGGTGSTPKHVFLTKATFAGDLKTAGGAADGLAGADKVCTDAAHAAGLPGSYKAWVSSPTVNALDRLADVGPWYQFPKGKDKVLTFQDKAALTGSPAASITTDETGGDEELVCIWTGTGADGKALADTCAGWTSSNTFDYGDLTENDEPAHWSAGGTCGGAARDSCVAAYHLYCFEQ